MKKIVCLMMTVAMLTAGLQGVVSADSKKEVFSDISDAKYAWAKDYIVEMANNGYIAGYEDNTYRPDNKVTRLETIVLFARAMGSNRAENEDVLSLAKNQFGKKVDSLGLNFGQDEVAFMLYRGALDEDDLNLYLTKNKASMAMPREEAAAIITKAMCAQEAAEAEVLVDMEYTDVKDISPDYSQYVFYVSEKGIMNGMDGGAFAPKDSVLRSQIAVMLYRAVDKMNLYIETAIVSNLDKAKNNISIIDAEEQEFSMGYTDYTKFYVNGKLVKEEDAYVNADARLTYINDELVFVDLFDKIVDKTQKGIFTGSTSVNSLVTVTIADPETDEEKEYEVSAGVVYENEDKTTAALSGFKAGTYVEFDILKGKIVRLTKLKKDSHILNAVIDEVGIEDELYIIISHEDEAYDGLKFVLTQKVDVYKNNDREDLSKIYKGDRVDIDIEYGKVVKLRALSDLKTLEGTIAEVTISSTPVLKAKINGEIKEFDVLPTAKITVSGKAGTVYDLRVGDSVKISVESGVVLSISSVAAAVTSNPIMGVIESINASRGFIKVNGEIIFCKDSSTTFISANGSTKAMRDLAVGTTVSIRGSIQNGAYTAALIIIED